MIIQKSSQLHDKMSRIKLFQKEQIVTKTKKAVRKFLTVVVIGKSSSKSHPPYIPWAYRPHLDLLEGWSNTCMVVMGTNHFNLLVTIEIVQFCCDQKQHSNNIKISWYKKHALWLVWNNIFLLGLKNLPICWYQKAHTESSTGVNPLNVPLRDWNEKIEGSKLHLVVWLAPLTAWNYKSWISVNKQFHVLK